MASLIYNSFFEDLARGFIDVDTDAFKVMLVSSAYVEDKDLHLKRSAITNEVTGTGYTAGGVSVVPVVTKDTALDRLDITLPGINLAGATITARKAVYYKARGGAASADEVVAVIDFGSDVISTAGTWSLTASTLRIQN